MHTKRDGISVLNQRCNSASIIPQLGKLDDMFIRDKGQGEGEKRKKKNEIKQWEREEKMRKASPSWHSNEYKHLLRFYLSSQQLQAFSQLMDTAECQSRPLKKIHIFLKKIKAHLCIAEENQVCTHSAWDGLDCFWPVPASNLEFIPNMPTRNILERFPYILNQHLGKVLRK